MEPASQAVLLTLQPPERTPMGLLRRKHDKAVSPEEKRELRQVQQEQVDITARLSYLEKYREVYTVRARGK